METPGTRIASPFALACNDEIKIEFTDEAHAVCSCGIVDAGKDFVKQHKARRMGIATLTIEAGDRSEERHGEPQGAFAA